MSIFNKIILIYPTIDFKGRILNIKNEFAENITDTSKLTRQKLGKNIKAKILTAHIQAVRILYGAPERTRTFTS